MTSLYTRPRSEEGPKNRPKSTSRDAMLADIRAIPYFETLGDAAADRLAGRVSLRRYGVREIVVAEDEPSAGLYYLRSGKARIYRTGPEGREQTLRLIVPGDTFGEVPVFDGKANPSTVEAIEPSAVLVVPADVLLGVVETNPAVAMYLLRHFASRMRSFTHLIQQISTQTVQSRLARYLYQLAREEGVATPEGIVVPREITQQDLASLLGSVREVISRSLHVMAEDGIVEVRRSDIVIRDLKGLERLL
jgi:CRP/FNR family transcriptional regulator